MKIIELGYCIDRSGLERDQFCAWTDVDPGNRVRIYTVDFRKCRPERARRIARRITDFFADKILDRRNAGALEPVESAWIVCVNIHNSNLVGTLADRDQNRRHVA